MKKPINPAIALLKTRQRAIASHYADIAINRDRLEAEALASLKAKDDFTNNFNEDLKMAYYYEGYDKARKNLETADLKDLLKFIDAIFGRDEIEDESDIKEVRREALRQCKEEFTDRSSKEFNTVSFWVSVIKADRRY